MTRITTAVLLVLIALNAAAFAIATTGLVSLVANLLGTVAMTLVILGVIDADFARGESA